MSQDLVTLVRIRGIDAREHRGKCPEETEKARAARDYLSALLAVAKELGDRPRFFGEREIKT